MSTPTKWLPPKGVGPACSGEKCNQKRNCAFGRACPAWDEVAPTLGGTLNPEWVAAQEQPTVATRINNVLAVLKALKQKEAKA